MRISEFDEEKKDTNELAQRVKYQKIVQKSANEFGDHSQFRNVFGASYDSRHAEPDVHTSLSLLT